jgi:hypothetical protein
MFEFSIKRNRTEEKLKKERKPKIKWRTCKETE